jgi:sugar/nucleoside kinase (ribokinase family)
MNYDIIILGHIVKEMIYFSDRIVGPVLGSPVAYSSVIAGKLGAKVGVVTRVGKDMPGYLLSPIFQVVLDRKGIKIEGEKTTLSKLIYLDSGDKRIEYPQKAPIISFEDIPKEYLNCKLAYICTMDYEVPLDVITKLKDLNIPLAIDLGGYGGAHGQTHPSEEKKKEPTLLKSYMADFEVVKASDEDCRFPAFNGEKEVIDRTGAGDSFTAGFLVEYLRSREPEYSAYYGSAVANYIIKRTGGVLLERMPAREDVEKILKQNKVKLK